MSRSLARWPGGCWDQCRQDLPWRWSPLEPDLSQVVPGSAGNSSGPWSPGASCTRRLPAGGEGCCDGGLWEGSHPNCFTTTHPDPRSYQPTPGRWACCQLAAGSPAAPSLGPGALASSCHQHPPALAESTGQMAGLGRGRAGGESRSALKDPASLSLGLGQVSFLVTGGEGWPGQRRLRPTLRGSAVTSLSPFVP